MHSLIIAKHTGGHSSINTKHLKCGNCGGNHTATHKQCSTRASYIDKLGARKSNSRRQKYSEAPPPPRMNLKNYPIPVFAHPMYQQAALTTSPIPDATDQNSDLFTMPKCQQMLDNLIASLQACKSKQQQAKVISDYAFKYLTYFPLIS